MRQRLYEGDHPDVASSMSNLAIDLRRAGEHERARELDEQALAMRQRLYDGDHPDLARCMSNLAIEWRLGKQPAKAGGCTETAARRYMAAASGRDLQRQAVPNGAT